MAVMGQLKITNRRRNHRTKKRIQLPILLYQNKKVYRDSEKGMIGGVCAGLFITLDRSAMDKNNIIISLFVSFGTSLFFISF